MSSLQRGLSVLLVAGAVLLAAWPARAQNAPPVPPSTSTVELERLVATLQDEAQRKRLVDDLKALIEAQRRLTPPEEAGPPVVETLTARVLALLADQLAAVSQAGLTIAATISEAPGLLLRLGDEVSDPDRRARNARIAGALAAVLVVSLLAEWLARRLLRPLRLRLERAAGTDGWLRLPIFLASLILNLVPLIAFGAVAYIILATLGADSAAGLVVAALVNAYLLARAVNLTSASVLSPGSAVLRFLPLGDEMAAYLHLWVRRFANIAIYGYFIAQAVVYAGLPVAFHDFLLRIVGLFGAMMVVALVLQSRTAVADWIAGGRATNGNAGDSVALAASRRLRRRLAGLWHVAAILYVLVALVVWLIRPADGGRFVLTATGLTALTWLAAGLAAAGARFAIERLFRVTDELRQRFPSLQARANQYLKLVNVIVDAVIYGFAALTTLHIWGARSLDWFATPFGRRATSGAVVVAVAMAVALVLWEMGNVMFERWVARPADGGVSINRREARVRTLMPILQLALLVVLALFVGFIVLSELGISIAPLLAGAGALGLAVGLGAQSMIKNLVTGMSMILSDTLAIGDVVWISDKWGVVEAISISAVQLRSPDGTLHTIPFGAITIVSNQTKDFAHAVFDIAVGYGEDVDRVTTIISEVGAGMRADPAFAPFILADLEMMGVDAFADRAMIVKARLKTLPGKQWDVSRAFNRRLKIAFDQAGIVMPLARQAVVSFTQAGTVNGPSAAGAALPVGPGPRGSAAPT